MMLLCAIGEDDPAVASTVTSLAVLCQLCCRFAVKGEPTHLASAIHKPVGVLVLLLSQ